MAANDLSRSPKFCGQIFGLGALAHRPLFPGRPLLRSPVVDSGANPQCRALYHVYTVIGLKDALEVNARCFAPLSRARLRRSRHGAALLLAARALLR